MSSFPPTTGMIGTTQLPLINFLVHTATTPQRLPQSKRPSSPPPDKRKKRPRRRPSRPASPYKHVTAPPLRGSDLPGEFSTVAAIIDVQLTPLYLGELSNSRKRNRSYGSIRRYLVEWAPEICPFTEVQKQRQAGFRTMSLEVLPQVHNPELDEDDTRDPCHGCGESAGDQSSAPPLFQCERCAKWWHAHYLPDSPNIEAILDTPVWT